MGARGRGRGRGLRVIAGSVGGLRLATPPGSDTRPTTDRVREALFAGLGPDVLEGAVVLDLFAGSGALGIEALSRGAARALFVDRSRTASDVVGDNLASTGLAERGRVVTIEARRFVRGSPPAEGPFSLVFMDPPYGGAGQDVVDLLVSLDERPGWLVLDATVVVERAAREGPALVAPGWRSPWSRVFGDTLVSFMVRDRSATEGKPQ